MASAAQQEVIETTGGSPAPLRFLIGYEDTTSLTSPHDPDVPVESAGVARTPSGVALGGVRHQFRDTPLGFDARLVVEFPACMPRRMVLKHRQHLAIEFSHWIELAFASDETD